MPDKNQKYRSVSVSQEDYAKYDQLRSELEEEWSRQIGKPMKVSVAEVIKTGMTFYMQRRKPENERQ
jgi:hypothetical protein